jgi:hypothetical protein
LRWCLNHPHLAAGTVLIKPNHHMSGWGRHHARYQAQSTSTLRWGWGWPRSHQSRGRRTKNEAYWWPTPFYTRMARTVMHSLTWPLWCPLGFFERWPPNIGPCPQGSALSSPPPWPTSLGHPQRNTYAVGRCHLSPEVIRLPFLVGPAVRLRGHHFFYSFPSWGMTNYGLAWTRERWIGEWNWTNWMRK